jgi:hypothetical protein
MFDLSGHVEDFVRPQVGQFDAGSMDRFQFLLLMHLGRDVANHHDQFGPRRPQAADRRNV